MIELAGWIAPAATMIAAMMTAANLGARVTGWGFVLFSAGAVAWVIVALGSGQQNLLWSNAFLLLVDLVGIWRWLGRQARYDAGADAAAIASGESTAPTLFASSTLNGKDVRGGDGAVIGHVVDAMAARGTGSISYLVVRQGGVGGVGESLHALDWAEIRIGDDAIDIALDGAALARRPVLDPESWPATSAVAIGR
jgi:sporulation protein YlmC with PRC-barrel domain